MQKIDSTQLANAAETRGWTFKDDGLGWVLQDESGAFVSWTGLHGDNKPSNPEHRIMAVGALSRVCRLLEVVDACIVEVPE